jgi:hypothetical protein
MQKELNFTLAELKKVVCKWLYLEDDTMIDVMCATYVGNLFQSDPLWVNFLAPPSHAKTELLRSFDGHTGIYFLSNLTPQTFISGKSQKNPSLLFKLKNKTLVLKDFGTVLVMRSENQQEILAQLREIYDGQYSKAFGNRKPIHWKGHMGLMVASTPVFDRHYAVMNMLGDRFLLYRARNANDEEIGKRAQEIVGKEEEMREEIQEAVHRFIDQFNTEDLKEVHIQTEDGVKKMIRTLGVFCAIARCAVSRNRYSRDIEHIPQAESPARLIKQFTQMSSALALVNCKRQVDTTIYALIKRLGQDLIPPLRLRILENFSHENIHEASWIVTRAVGEAINLPTNTVRLALEDMMALGLLNRKRETESDTAPYEWQLSHRCRILLEGAEVFGDVPF